MRVVIIEKPCFLFIKVMFQGTGDEARIIFQKTVVRKQKSVEKIENRKRKESCFQISDFPTALSFSRLWRDPAIWRWQISVNCFLTSMKLVNCYV